jgi:adenylylsulfate kinase-like enzyme
MENPKEDHLSHGHDLSAKAQPLSETKYQYIWVITGPAGCGKTTVAQFLSKNLSLNYLEGDDVSTPTPLYQTYQTFS